MKRFHVHVRISDLDEAVRFYTTMFGIAPSVLKADYAKWMLEDPRINFAISPGQAAAGLDHLGLQVESDEELAAISQRLETASVTVRKQENATCCYARGNKGWVADPAGISWETFHTFGASTIYGNDLAPAATEASGCCPSDLPGTTCCGTTQSG